MPLQKVGPSTSGYALDVEGVTGAVVVEDLELDSPPGQAPGESSIAVFISQASNVLLRRVTAKGGNGADGADAVPTSNWDGGAAPNGNDAGTSLGASARDCSCPDGTHSIGAAGGGTAQGGADGGPELPENPTGQIPPHDGKGASVACATGAAHPGASAPSADGGVVGSGFAGKVADTGWVRADGTSGGSGGAGQGGGGGGGNAVATGMNNEGGGGGGCGGCGGAGGPGGGSGGSSFAILVFQATVTADSCTLLAGGGGAGKIGGTAQDGQAGGSPGNPAQSGLGCVGAIGGKGGPGAGGGGGAGGNAIAIGYVGSKPTVTAGTMQEGNAGAHGNGGSGSGANDGLPGADGIKADLQELQ